MADRIISLPDGRNVCIHFTTTLKRVDETFDELLFNRLMLLMRNPPRLPGKNGCFHALMAEDIVPQFYHHEADYDHSYFTLVWWARTLISHDFKKLRNQSFLERSALRIDHLFRELDKRDGTLDTAPVYLPEELCRNSDHGEFLNMVKMKT